MDDPQVILRVDAESDRLAQDPVIGQRFWPVGIDLELRRGDHVLCLRVEGALADAQGDERGHESGTDQKVTSAIHMRHQIKSLHHEEHEEHEGGVFSSAFLPPVR